MKISNKFVLTLFFAIFIASPALCLALNVDPSNIKVTLRSEETKEYTINILNAGSTDLKIKAYTEDWVIASDGSKNFIKAGSSVYSCSNWIKLDPTVFNLGPKESKPVSFKITAPKNINGGHVSVVFFEVDLGTVEGIAVSGRIGTIIYQETEGDVRKDIEANDLKVRSTTEGLPVNMQVFLKNKGNSYVSLKPNIKIINRNNDKDTIEKQLNPYNLLPADETNINEMILPGLKEGDYKLEIELNFDDKTIKKDTEFSIKKTSSK